MRQRGVGLCAAVVACWVGLAMAAVAAERVVVVEEITATWCSHCATMGPRYGQMLDTYPDTFAFVMIHHGDDYATTWGNARANFYTDFGGYPTSFWDGGLIKAEGSGHTYNDLVNYYNQRRAAPTDVTMSLTGQQLSEQTYEFTATVGIEAGGTGKTLRIYMIQTLDHWPTTPNWGRTCFKQAATTQDVTLAAGETAQVARTFTFDSASWANPQDIAIYAWAQEPQATSPSTNRAEIFQGAIMRWPFMIDCNSNGVPDEQDIASGTSADCNSTGVPDECEMIDNPPIVIQSSFQATEYANAQSFTDSPYPQYTIKQWDDFMVPYEVALGAGEAYFRPTTWGGFGNIGFLVEIANVPGGAEASGNVLASTVGQGANGVVSWDFGGVTLPAGTYWLSVQATGGFTSYGMVYWHRTNVGAPNGSTHYYHNPDGGWGHGTTPQPTTSWPYTAADMAFTQHIIKLADCNLNGILDECDIAAGTSQDANGNQIPDECEGGQTVCAGDANCDGVISWRDIDFFVAAMNDNVAAWEAMFAPGTPNCLFGNNDVNADGTVSWRDIDPLVAVMNTVCP